MTSFQDIPVEILLKIISYLDRATLLIASSVSRQWKTLIHDTSWQFLCNSLNSNQDRDLRQQLEFYGWENESHSANECRYILSTYTKSTLKPVHFPFFIRCISIYLDNFPFVNPPNLETLNQRCKEVFKDMKCRAQCHLSTSVNSCRVCKPQRGP